MIYYYSLLHAKIIVFCNEYIEQEEEKERSYVAYTRRGKKRRLIIKLNFP
jgi:hypothetical protein